MMKLTVRIYKMHDLDLLSILSRKETKKAPLVKKALAAYIRGENFNPKIGGVNGTIKGLKDLRFTVCLNEKKDRDIIDFILGIHPGFRNAAIKKIIRLFLPFNMEIYAEDGTKIPKLPIKAVLEENAEEIHAKETAVKEPEKIVNKKEVTPEPERMPEPAAIPEPDFIDEIPESEDEDFDLFSQVDAMINGKTG